MNDKTVDHVLSVIILSILFSRGISIGLIICARYNRQSEISDG